MGHLRPKSLARHFYLIQRGTVVVTASGQNETSRVLVKWSGCTSDQLGTLLPGCGSNLNRRGKPQVLVPMFPLTRVTHFGVGFLSHSHQVGTLLPGWDATPLFCLCLCDSLSATFVRGVFLLGGGSGPKSSSSYATQRGLCLLRSLFNHPLKRLWTN